MSTLYRFIPNAWARTKFNLAAAHYDDASVTALITRVLGGEDAFDKYAIASDPFAGGATSAHVAIKLPQDEAHENTQGRIFPLIGEIAKLSI